MPNDNKKKTTPDINEEFMMNLMVDGIKKDGLHHEQIPVSQQSDSVESKDKVNNKVNTKVRKTTEIDYESLFFQKTLTHARDGKTVYIRPEYHEKLTRIIQVIGEDKITIYAYLDHVLTYHFQEFSEQITKSYNDKYKPI